MELSPQELKKNSLPLAFFLSFALIIINSCSFFMFHRSQPNISVPPSSIETVSGYFSFQLERERTIYQGRALLYLAPNKGRLEIRDLFGRLISIFFWSNHHEWLILPAEKAYWSGTRDRSSLMAEIFGFPLEPIELLAWIIRNGQSLEPLDESMNLVWAIKGEANRSWHNQLLEERQAKWLVEWDEEGKLKQGQKGDLKIEIQDLTKDKRIARRLNFYHPQAKGRLTVLKLEFNQALSSDSFEAEKFIHLGFQVLSWEQIKSRLRGE